MINEIMIGQIINVQAYKSDGVLYRQWNGAKVIEVSPETIVLFLYKTKVVELNLQKWIIREPMIWFFPISEWFNTTALIRKSGTFFYTNLSSMPLYEEKTIKFIDYDLDIKHYPGVPTKIVDKIDFEKNKIKYNYSKKLISVIEKTTKQILKLIEFHDAFFNEEVIDQYVKELLETKQISLKTSNEIRN